MKVLNCNRENLIKVLAYEYSISDMEYKYFYEKKTIDPTCEHNIAEYVRLKVKLFEIAYMFDIDDEMLYEFGEIKKHNDCKEFYDYIFKDDKSYNKLSQLIEAHKNEKYEYLSK